MRFVFLGRWAFRAMAALTVVLLATCSSVSEVARTKPLSGENRAGGSNSLQLKPYYENGVQKHALVGVAISGGGSRASNFAAAVLAELDQLDVLRHVNTISSVSGGSVAASYLALHGYDDSGDAREQNKTAFWAKARKDLSADLRTSWLWRWARPDWLLSTTFGNRTRTDVMAEIFDEAFLGQKTFGDLKDSAPALFINATAVNDIPQVLLDQGCTNRGLAAQRQRWESVSLDWEFVTGCLNADFGQFKLSTAVAASAAFPGIFNSVALAKHPSASSGRPPEYVHLIDGGPSDNLGMEGLLRALLRQRKVDACLLIVIDAFAQGDADDRFTRNDLRGVVGRVVDLNFFDSIDAMLARRRYDTLLRMELPPRRQMDVYGGLLVINDFPLPGQAYSFLRPATTFRENVPLSAIRGEKAVAGEPACAVWTIAIDNIPSLMVGQAIADGELKYVVPSSTSMDRDLQLQWAARREVRHRVKIGEASARLATDFNLKGPEECGREQLRDIAWEAGRIAVQDDPTSRAKVCKWLTAKNWIVAEACAVPPPQPPELDFDIQFDRAASDPRLSSIRCVARNSRASQPVAPPG